MPITIILIIANVIFTYQGFAKPALMQRYKFQVGPILHGKQYDRIITSGFLHVDWNHLIMNMISLYFMGEALELLYGGMYGKLGMLVYLLVYLGSLVGGDALALLMHRNNGSYSAVGASGAISGVIFALLVIAPTAEILMFLFLPMPFWLFAVIYVAYSLFGIRTRFHNIGHEAHLGGALLGMALGCLFAPEAALRNWVFLASLAVPTIAILYLLYKNPSFGNDPLEWVKRRLNVGGAGGGGNPHNSSNYSNSNPYNPPVKQDGLEVNRRAVLQRELDILLDKVSRKGYNHLTETERQRLDQLGRELGRDTNMGGGRAPGS